MNDNITVFDADAAGVRLLQRILEGYSIYRCVGQVDIRSGVDDVFIHLDPLLCFLSPETERSGRSQRPNTFCGGKKSRVLPSQRKHPEVTKHPQNVFVLMESRYLSGRNRPPAHGML